MKKIQKSKVKKLCLVLAVLIVVVVGTLAILPAKVEAGARWGIWIEWWLYGVDLSHCGGSTAINCVVIWP